MLQEPELEYELLWPRRPIAEPINKPPPSATPTISMGLRS
jgi:hypothetical protein